MAIGDFEGTTPPFLPEEFFNGRLEGWGVSESLAPAKAEPNHRRRRLLGTHEQAVHFTEIYRLSRLNNTNNQPDWCHTSEATRAADDIGSQCRGSRQRQRSRFSIA